MKNKNCFLKLIGAALFFAAFGAIQIFAQPSEAQLKKVLTSPKTISVTLGDVGTVEWSKTYKKYIWTRDFTAKLKTETPGEFLIVKGYAAYDVIGRRYVFWRTFTSSNEYAGKKNPSAAEINQALENAMFSDFTMGNVIIGEYESLRLADNPDWEWHAPNSVSFTVVVVFNAVNSGASYGDEPQYQYKQGFKAIDKIEAYRRVRIYRNSASEPWNNAGVSRNIPSLESKYRTRTVEKLLDRRVLPEAEVERMAKMSKIPLLSN